MIGERISELRKEMGLTQKELADMLSVSKYTISSYETDRTSPDDHNKILLAQIFDVSLDYLMGLVDDPMPYDRGGEIVQLPRQFDQMQVSQVYDYIGYLSYQSRRKRRRKSKRARV